MLNLKAVKSVAFRFAICLGFALLFNLGLYYSPMMVGALGILALLGVFAKFAYDTEVDRLESLERLNKE
jgi:hypothetical protein